MRIGFLTLCSAVLLSVPGLLGQGAGNALYFDGTDDKVLVSLGEPYGAYTAEVWARPDGLRSGENDKVQLLCKWGADYNDPLRIMMATGGISGALEQGSIYETGATSADDGAWQHCALVYTGSTLSLYVNGGLISSIGAPGSYTATSYLGIGGNPLYAGDEFFRGWIDEVRIWQGARSQEDIWDDMYRTLTGSEDSLIAYYQFNESSGASLPDLVADGDDGTLWNMSDTSWQTSSAPLATSVTGSLYDVRGVWNTHAKDSSSVLQVDVMSAGDDDCVLWGHDNGALSFDNTDVPDGVAQRLHRAWRMEEYGTVTADVIIRCTGLGFDTGADLRLLVDDDGDFSDAQVVTGTYADQTFTVASREIVHGNYYTLGSVSITPVTLSSFTAGRMDGRPALFWTTETEQGNLGFNVQGAADRQGPYVQRNARLIPGAGTTSVPQSYMFELPDDPSGGIYYRLEQVDVNGTRMYSAPLAVEATLYGTGITAETDNEMSPVPAGGAVYYNLRGIRQDLSGTRSSGIYVVRYPDGILRRFLVSPAAPVH